MSSLFNLIECISNNHVWQYVSKLGRPGSANGLKARSQPGGERLEEIALLAELELCPGRCTILSRSLLLDRSTEGAIMAALSAATDSVSAQTAPAMKELKSEAAIILAATLGVRNFIMPDTFPALFERFCYREG
jgi:hypothetical protein